MTGGEAVSGARDTSWRSQGDNGERDDLSGLRGAQCPRNGVLLGLRRLPRLGRPGGGGAGADASRSAATGHRTATGPADTTGCRQPAPGCPAAGRRAAVGTAGRATGPIVAPDPTGRRCRRTDRGTTGSPRLERRRTDIRDTATRRFQRRIDRPGGRPAAGWLAGIGLGRPGAGSTAARPAGSAAAGPAGLPGTARATSADRGSLSPLRCRQQRVAAVLQQVRAGASWSDVARRRRSKK